MTYRSYSLCCTIHASAYLTPKSLCLSLPYCAIASPPCPATSLFSKAVRCSGLDWSLDVGCLTGNINFCLWPRSVLKERFICKSRANILSGWRGKCVCPEGENLGDAPQNLLQKGTSALLPYALIILFFLLQIILYFPSQSLPPPSLHLQIPIVKAPNSNMNFWRVDWRVIH